MKLLFLDTETSGLRYQEDEIIEIGGVIMEWKNGTLQFVSAFESLVKPNMQVGDQTTRITGIDNIMLSSAPSKSSVHDAWYEWLHEFDDIECIVGHYIQFDIQFLENERWYLPKHVLLDTLELAKLFCPDSEAVNLERLIKKYDLHPGNILPAKYLDKESSHHRALYDSGVCAALYSFIIQRIYSTSWPDELKPYLEGVYLGTERELYTGAKLQLASQKAPYQTYKWSSSKPQASFVDMIGAIEPTLWISSLSEYQDLPQSIRRSLLQITVMGIWKWQGRDVYYHRGMGSNKIITYILKSFTPEQAIEYRWPYAFTLFASLQYLYKQSVSLNSIASLSDELLSILPDHSEVSPLLKEFSVQCDFIQFQLKARNIINQWTVYNEVPRTQQEWIRQKFLDMNTNLKKILSLEWSDDRFMESARADFLKLGTILSSHRNIHMRIGNYITLTTEKSTQIEQELKDVIQSRPGDIPTRYSKDQMKAFETMLGFDSVWADRLSYVEMKDYQLWEGIPELIDVIKPPQNGVKVVLCGQNSNLKDCWRVVDEHDMFDSVLVLGEVGSTRKIISRLLAGFTGTVVVRSKDWHQFVSYQEKFQLQEIIHIHPPYWVIDSFWYGRSKQSSDPEAFMSKLKKLRAHGQLLEIADAFETPLRYVRQYV